MKVNRPWTEQEAQYVREQRALGITAQKIGKALGRSPASVANYCQWNAIPLQKAEEVALPPAPPPVDPLQAADDPYAPQ